MALGGKEASLDVFLATGVKVENEVNGAGGEVPISAAISAIEGVTLGKVGQGVPSVPLHSKKAKEKGIFILPRGFRSDSGHCPITAGNGQATDRRGGLKTLPDVSKVFQKGT